MRKSGCRWKLNQCQWIVSFSFCVCVSRIEQRFSFGMHNRIWLTGEPYYYPRMGSIQLVSSSHPAVPHTIALAPNQFNSNSVANRNQWESARRVQCEFPIQYVTQNIIHGKNVHRKYASESEQTLTFLVLTHFGVRSISALYLIKW